MEAVTRIDARGPHNWHQKEKLCVYCKARATDGVEIMRPVAFLSRGATINRGLGPVVFYTCRMHISKGMKDPDLKG